MCVIRIFEMSHKLIVKWSWWFAFVFGYWWAKWMSIGLFGGIWNSIPYIFTKTKKKFLTINYTLSFDPIVDAYRLVVSSRYCLAWLSLWPRDTFKSFLIERHTHSRSEKWTRHSSQWSMNMTAISPAVHQYIQIRWTFPNQQQRYFSCLLLLDSKIETIYFHSKAIDLFYILSFICHSIQIFCVTKRIWSHEFFIYSWKFFPLLKHQQN